MTVSRTAVGAILLAAVAVLLAIGLFVAGAMWRARVTGMAGPRAGSRACTTPRASWSSSAPDSTYAGVMSVCVKSSPTNSRVSPAVAADA